MFNDSLQGEDNATYTDSAVIASKVSVTGLLDNDQLTSITLDGQETHTGVYPNKIKPSDAAIGSATDNYNINYISGTLTISNTPLTVTIIGNTDTKTYDGSEQSVTGYTISIPEGASLTEADIIGPESAIAQGTNVKTENGGKYMMGLTTDQFSSINPDYDVTFDVTDGWLIITKRSVTFSITPEYDTKTYDGNIMVVNASNLTTTGLASDDEVTGGQIKTESYLVGEYTCSEGSFEAGYEGVAYKEGFEIKNSSGEIITSSYNPAFTVKLTIAPAPLTITANSATKVYDGTPLIDDGFVVSSTLGSGDVVTATVNGSQTCKGESTNVIDPATVQVTHDNGDGTYTDVTDNYSPVTLTDGILKVNPLTSGFSCPNDVTVTLPEGVHEKTLTESDLNGPATLTPANAHTHVGSNLNDLNPVSVGTYTVTWTLYDDCDSVLTTCDQTVTVEHTTCVGVTWQGHDYNAVLVGSQCWLAENLRWETGNHHTYQDEADNLDKFGYLYSWYTAVGLSENDDNAAPATLIGDNGEPYVQGICPTGWAVPSMADLAELNLASGGTALLKDPITEYWLPGFEGVPGGTGFNARGGGRHNAAMDRYEDLLTGYHFWASDATPGTTTLLSACVTYYCDQIILTDPSRKNDRKSVRCLRKVAP